MERHFARIAAVQKCLLIVLRQRRENTGYGLGQGSEQYLFQLNTYGALMSGRSDQGRSVSTGRKKRKKKAAANLMLTFNHVNGLCAHET